MRAQSDRPILLHNLLWRIRPGCFKLNWMSGNQPIESAVDQILKNVDLASIQDERARECIRLLLNLVESLNTELRQAQAEIAILREQLKNRKGRSGKPGGLTGRKSSARSSEKE